MTQTILFLLAALLLRLAALGSAGVLVFDALLTLLQRKQSLKRAMWISTNYTPSPALLRVLASESQLDDFVLYLASTLLNTGEDVWFEGSELVRRFNAVRPLPLLIPNEQGLPAVVVERAIAYAERLHAEGALTEEDAQRLMIHLDALISTAKESPRVKLN